MRSIVAIAWAGALAACAERGPTAPAPSLPSAAMARGTSVEVLSAPSAEDVDAAIAAYQAAAPPPDAPGPPAVPRWIGEGPRASFRSVRQHVFACYQRALKLDPSLAGTLQIEIVVDADGRAKSARAIRSTFADTSIIACIVSAMMRVEFEAGGQHDATLVIPFVFVPPAW
jgi:periplasmic protein TonB